MNRFGRVLLVGASLLASCSNETQPPFTYAGREDAYQVRASEGYVPRSGLVPSAQAAARIAEAVAFEVYGEEPIRKQRPYRVTDTPAIWIVRGVLPEGAIGGTFEVVISKKTGAILFVRHTK